jgi:hypothetical protein
MSQSKSSKHSVAMSQETGAGADRSGRGMRDAERGGEGKRREGGMRDLNAFSIEAVSRMRVGAGSRYCLQSIQYDRQSSGILRDSIEE